MGTNELAAKRARLAEAMARSEIVRLAEYIRQSDDVVRTEQEFLPVRFNEITVSDGVIVEVVGAVRSQVNRQLSDGKMVTVQGRRWIIVRKALVGFTGEITSTGKCADVSPFWLVSHDGTRDFVADGEAAFNEFLTHTVQVGRDRGKAAWMPLNHGSTVARKAFTPIITRKRALDEIRLS